MQKVKVGDIFVTETTREEWLVVMDNCPGHHKISAVSKSTRNIGHTAKLEWEVIREADEETLRWVEEVLGNG